MKLESCCRLILLLSLVVLQCCRERPENKQEATSRHTTVKAVQAISKQVAEEERAPGSIRPVSDATIEAKVSGRVEKLHVQEGRIVKAGELLLELTAREIQARLEQALASERQSRQDLERFSRLLPSGAITKQEYDAAEAKAKVATANVLEARTMASYTKIEAPFDGLVTKKLVNEGDLAQPGRALLIVERQDLYRFEADIPESIASKLEIGGEYNISLTGISEKLVGKLAELSPTADSNSRTRRAKFDVSADPRIHSGQFGYVSVPVAQRPSIYIPSSALFERGQLECVYVISDGRALLRLVRTGKRSADEVEIVSGLTPSDMVVVQQPQLISDGDYVEAAQ